MKILVLAPSGFGKTISACGCIEPDLGILIEGLSPEDTYFISETSKPLPRRGSAKLFPVVDVPKKDSNMVTIIPHGRRVITQDAYIAAAVINYLATVSVIKNIVIDDTNYYMQDYMMKKSLATGWDAPKKAGHFMSELFDAVEKAGKAGKRVFMLAHYETSKKDNLGNVTLQMKTTGNAVDRGITPEGKFDVTLFGNTKFNEATKKVERYYVTNDDGFFPAKSAPGMFPLHIPNDLGFVAKCMQAYYDGEDMPVSIIDQPVIEETPVAQAEETVDSSPVAEVPVAEETVTETVQDTPIVEDDEENPLLPSN